MKLTQRVCRIRSTRPFQPCGRALCRTFSSSPYTYGRLDGKVIVVAGAGNPPEEGHGIGASTALLLARHGAKVVAVAHAQINADTIAKAILDEGNHATGLVADCTRNEDVSQVVKAVMAEHGRVDCVVNAGIHSALPMGFGKMTPEAWQTGIDLNLNAHFHLIHQFLPVFLEQKSGNFIHFTTIASSVGLGIGRQRHAYAAGKAGAATLTKRIGVEYAKEGIRGNVIGIGYVDGPLVNRAVKQGGADLGKVTATRDAYVPRGKQGQPMEVAKVCAFLASDDSSIVNGSEIYADGGTSGCTYGP